MALDFAAKVDPSQYPNTNTRLREFTVFLSDEEGSLAFIPLFLTRPAPTGETASGSFAGTVLDAADYRLTGATDVVSATVKLAYKADGSSTVVDLTSTIDITVASNSIAAMTMAALNGASNNDGFVPVIPDNALVGLVPSADLSSGAACAITLRLATRDQTG